MSDLLAMIGALVIATEPVQATERTVDRDASWRMLQCGLLRGLCGSFHTASADCRYSQRERADEICLRRGVGLSVIPVLSSEAGLEGLITRSSVGIGA